MAQRENAATELCLTSLYAPRLHLQGNAHRSGSMLEAREKEPYMVLMLRSSDAVELMVNGSSCASTSDLLADGMLASRAAASGRLSTPGESESKMLARHLSRLIVQAAIDTGVEK